MQASKLRVVLLIVGLMMGASVFAGKLAAQVYYPETKTIPAPASHVNRDAVAYRDRVNSMLNSASRPRPVQLVIRKGSLKANIERIAGLYGWHHVIWKSPEDYNWVAGTTRIHADNLPDALSHLLQNYPLQATFYNGNHLLVIIPRNLA